MIDRAPILERVKHLLEIEPDNTDRDTELAGLVELALGTAKAYLGRDLDSKEYTENHYHINGAVVLRNWPVVTVSQVLVDGVDTPTNWFIESSGVLQGKPGNFARPVFANTVTVTYTAGYTGEEAPALLIDALAMIAAASAEHNDYSGNAGEMKGESIPGVYSATYETSGGGGDGFGMIGPQAKQYLDLFRDKRVG